MKKIYRNEAFREELKIDITLKNYRIQRKMEITLIRMNVNIIISESIKKNLKLRT